MKQIFTTNSGTVYENQESKWYIQERGEKRYPIDVIVGSVPQEKEYRDDMGVLRLKLTEKGYIDGLEKDVIIGLRILFMEPKQIGITWTRDDIGIRILKDEGVCWPCYMQSCYKRISSPVVEVNISTE